jgi:hypothetical protein
VTNAEIDCMNIVSYVFLIHVEGLEREETTRKGIGVLRHLSHTSGKDVYEVESFLRFEHVIIFL